MLGGKRCYLCGGKLVNGRCVECGLDNEKNTKKVYHLNEIVKMQDSQPRDAVQKIGKGLAIGSVILLVAAVGAVALNSYFEEQEKGQSQSGEEYDEYQFAKRQLSETGEAYDEVLTGGYYEVGVHIPEGIYTVEAQDGESAIYLIDDENGIYIWQQIGNDPEQLDWLLEKFVHYPDAKIEYFSSGEYAKFAFLARLYWMLEGCQREKRLYENKWGKNIFGNEESLLLGETAVIFIDEGEVYYHPEWQRCYIDILLKMINENLNQERVQVVITTNSPFILSDVLREDVVYLSGEEEKITEMREKEITFGQNIHRLLRRNFFMEATIGEYAKTMIQEMIGVLQGGKKSKAARMEDIRKFLHQYYTEVKDGEEYEDVQRLIHQVGEPIYRDNLEKLVSIHKAEDKNWQIREMQKEIQQLEERIQRLKHD